MSLCAVVIGYQSTSVMVQRGVRRREIPPRVVPISHPNPCIHWDVDDMGQKIVLAGMACKDWIDYSRTEFNLDLQLLSLCYVAMQYYHACMFRSVYGMLELLCPSVVALA